MSGATVKAADRMAATAGSGEATLEVPAGPHRVEVAFEGLQPETAEVTVAEGGEVSLLVELREPLELEEEVIVSATRTGKRLQDQPARVEVLEREAIEEKLLNAENLTDARQTRHDPLVLPSRAPDGRWTVDAWAPLEGRTINGGVRLAF